MNNPIAWFEIYVDDIARARAFYEGVLGVSLTRLQTPGDEMWAFPSDQQSYGASGCLVQQAGLQDGPANTRVYFSCADCAVEAARATRYGGRVAQEKTSIGPYGHYALLRDPAGNVIGLHSMQ
jgi:predicted enzyme related to lactoylglutathione lyase